MSLFFIIILHIDVVAARRLFSQRAHLHFKQLHRVRGVEHVLLLIVVVAVTDRLQQALELGHGHVLLDFLHRALG